MANQAPNKQYKYGVGAAEIMRAAPGNGGEGLIPQYLKERRGPKEQREETPYARNRRLPKTVRRSQRMARRTAKKGGYTPKQNPEKLSGFGFYMIVGVAIIKDVFDVVAAWIAMAILSFGASIASGVVIGEITGSTLAGILGGAFVNLLKFTGIGGIAIGAVNVGMAAGFTLAALLFSLFLQFIIIAYLTFQGVFGIERGIARKLAVVSFSIIISVLPLINWLPETTGALFALRHFDKNRGEKEKQNTRTPRAQGQTSLAPAV